MTLSIRPVLEILIPTYKRPHCAERAARSIAKAMDDRVHTSIRSNGFEPILAALDLPRTTYKFFSENRGAIANFRELIRDSHAEYILLLSDEDAVDANEIDSFIRFLEKLKPAVALCDIVTADEKAYFSISSLGIDRLSSSDLERFWPLDPTYMSGTTLRRDLLDDALLENSFQERPENIYPHVLLRNRLSLNGDIGVYARPLVHKGAEAEVGGDSHAHIATQSHGSQLSTLNPAIYGPIARIRQVGFHRQRLPQSFGKERSHGWLRLYSFLMWLRITDRAADATGSAEPDAASVTAALGDSYFANRLFRSLITVRPLSLRRVIIDVLWYAVLTLKAAAMAFRFGLSAAIRQIRGRRTI